MSYAACMWTAIVGVIAVLHCAQAVTDCIQRDPNTRDVLQVLKCKDGCCGNEMTYQVCCEVLHPPNRMYTQYDLWRGWNPATIFLFIFVLLAVIAAFVTLIFCIIRACRKDKRTCSWM